jgi:very-short-patch-repair endonuclease
MSPLETMLAMHLKAAKLPSPAREYKFCKGRRWRFDFAYPDLKIGIECEGGTWVKGRHNTGTGFAEDCLKYNQAALEGWKILRFTGEHIKSGIALQTIEQAVSNKNSWRTAMGDDSEETTNNNLLDHRKTARAGNRPTR